MSRLALVLLALAACLHARAADSIFTDGKADPKAAPEAYLQAKGLLKAGANYVLQVDANLPGLLRDVRAAKVKADAATAKRADLERQIERAKDAYVAAQREVAAVSEQLSRVKKGDTRRYNDLVGDARAADVRRLEAARVIEARQKDLARATEGQHDYVGLTVALAEQMQAAARQYAALAADAGVAAAIAALNARGGARVALGPSGQFTAELAAALQARDVVAARAIKLTFEGGTPHALVTLNGKTSILMTVDSGASLVTVTADVAKDMGLRPDPGVAPLTLVVADGKRVEARQATIATVRVGPYTVSDVKCAIMPASVKGSNLLGGTFLRNFTVRLDIAARELHMTPVGPQVVVSATPVGITTTTQPSAVTPDPTNKPDAATPPASASAPPAAAEPTVLTVAGDRPWPGSIQVRKGETLVFSASGRVSYRRGANGAGPDGRSTPDGGMSSYLEARLGDTGARFKIGSSSTYLVPADGTLFLQAHDGDGGHKDNGGQFVVKVTRYAPGTSPPTLPDVADAGARAAFTPVGVWTKVDTGARFTFQPDGTVTCPDSKNAVYTKGQWTLRPGPEVHVAYPEDRWATFTVDPDGRLRGRTSIKIVWVLRRE